MERTQALVLPEEGQFKADIQAINRFQQVARANMVEGTDWGIIPGTGNKPTLLKPGAEKIAKLLGLADQYEIVDKLEDWQTGFFRYLIKCTLSSVATGAVISEGLGECNSMESKYRWRWVFPDDVPESVDKATLAKKTGRRRDGKGTYTQYRLENEDIYSQVNTILKMAKKRALVDAALSAGRLSQVFTQDIEDMAVTHDEPVIVKPRAQATVTKPSPEVAPVPPEAGTDTAVAVIEPVEPSEESEQKIPSTIQELLQWVASHGKEYTRTWIVNSLKIKEERLSTDPAGCYQDIKDMAGEKGMKGWED